MPTGSMAASSPMPLKRMTAVDRSRLTAICPFLRASSLRFGVAGSVLLLRSSAMSQRFHEPVDRELQSLDFPNKKLHYKRYGQSQHRQATGDGDGKAQNKHIDLTDRTSKQREKDIDQENDDEHGCRQFQSHHEHVLKEAKDIISHSSRERSAERRNSLIAGKNRGHQK